MEERKRMAEKVSFVREYNKYKTHWEAEVGEEACLKQEPEKKFDSKAVAVVIRPVTEHRHQQEQREERHPNEYFMKKKK